MCLAFDLSVRLGLCPAEDATRVREHLSGVGLLTDLPQGTRDPDRLLAHMARDKKVSDGRITFVLARGIGQAFLSNDVPHSTVSELLSDNSG